MTQPRLPSLFVIGAMKCATSTLHDQLAAQPGIFMSTPKEPCFFSDDDIYARGIDTYAELFADAPADALLGESSTHYTKLPTHPDTVERLAAVIDDPRLIYVMRHPVDRLISHHIHEWTQGVVDTSDVDEALAQLPELIDYGRYAHQLRPWLERFGPDRVLPVFLQRLSAHPQEQLDRVGRHIGRGDLEWLDLDADNVSAARMRVNPLRDRIVNAPLVTAVRTRLPQEWRDRIKQRWQMTERPEISEATRTRVSAVFDEDLAELGAWLGIEMSCAKFEAATDVAELSWTAATPGQPS